VSSHQGCVVSTSHRRLALFAATMLAGLALSAVEGRGALAQTAQTAPAAPETAPTSVGEIVANAASFIAWAAKRLRRSPC
jgi:hypothetical protein